MGGVLVLMGGVLVVMGGVLVVMGGILVVMGGGCDVVCLPGAEVTIGGETFWQDKVLWEEGAGGGEGAKRGTERWGRREGGDWEGGREGAKGGRGVKNGQYNMYTSSVHLLHILTETNPV